MSRLLASHEREAQCRTDAGEPHGGARLSPGSHKAAGQSCLRRPFIPRPALATWTESRMWALETDRQSVGMPGS